jgi:hypothetical protein
MNQEQAVEVLIYDVTDLRKVLGIGRPLAYRLMRQLGRRVGRRMVVARVVVERWLARPQRPRAKATSARRPTRRSSVAA